MRRIVRAFILLIPIIIILATAGYYVAEPNKFHSMSSSYLSTHNMSLLLQIHDIHKPSKRERLLLVLSWGLFPHIRNLFRDHKMMKHKTEAIFMKPSESKLPKGVIKCRVLAKSNCIKKLNIKEEINNWVTNKDYVKCAKLLYNLCIENKGLPYTYLSRKPLGS